MFAAVGWGAVAAASLLIGYYLAARGLSGRTVGLVMDFCAGTLLSAIAYELVPALMPAGPGVAVAFLAGALAFFGGDWIVDGRGGAQRRAIVSVEATGSGAAIFVGTLLDNMPESMILGMGLALGGVVNTERGIP